MAMGSQFSLSLELTKLVPFGSLVNASGHGLVKLLRQIQASGSDFVTEQDLAEVFGRNRVDPLFASTFRTAVRQSLIHEISGIAEIVIEGGAGPTVRRSFNEPAYFAMVVQLSLLTYTHELITLTKALVKALERRAQGSTEYVAPPGYDGLKGALRAIREQTCGFMWELVISAVENKLYPSFLWTDGSFYTLRLIPPNILQALLDSFTAVQHLPESTRLRINTPIGISTIVVWAHQVLGLTVKVNFDHKEHVFGAGSPSVFIDHETQHSPEIALLNETDDLYFSLSEAHEDVRLESVRRHPVKDYGTQMLRLQDDDLSRERDMIFAIVTSCIKLAQERTEARQKGVLETGRERLFPAVHRVVSVSKWLFASNEDVIDAIDVDSNLPCALREVLAHHATPRLPSHYGGSKALMYLSHVLFVLSMAKGFDEEMGLYIDILDKEQYSAALTPDARHAFSSLAYLLHGSMQSPTPYLGSVSVISAWGWSLSLGSVGSYDPSAAAMVELSFIRGVPARGGERKRYIIDGVGPLGKIVHPMEAFHRSKFAIAAGPGEECVLESWTKPQNPKYFIGTDEHAFEVVTVPACGSRMTGDGNVIPDRISLGFRSMQELSWDVIHIPTCDHLATLGQSLTLPDGVWAFRGFTSPIDHHRRGDGVFAGLVAGDSPSRWILAGMMKAAHRKVGSVLFFKETAAKHERTSHDVASDAQWANMPGPAGSSSGNSRMVWRQIETTTYHIVVKMLDH
ncbi:MAG: hypothetical protein Q9183_000701 [Haloplaca sp. 2 TL-2023]